MSRAEKEDVNSAQQAFGKKSSCSHRRRKQLLSLLRLGTRSFCWGFLDREQGCHGIPGLAGDGGPNGTSPIKAGEEVEFGPVHPSPCWSRVRQQSRLALQQCEVAWSLPAEGCLLQVS